MSREQHIMHDFDENSPLTGLEKNLPLEIPQNYFLDFQHQLKEVIQIEDRNWGKTLPYQIENKYYFENFAEKIIFTTQHSELFQLKNSNPFLVPQDYFVQFPSQLLIATHQGNHKKANTISFKILLNKISLKYAAILLLFISVGLGIMSITHTNNNKVDNMLASVPKSEIDEYLDKNVVDADWNPIQITLGAENNVLKFDEKEINQYFNEVSLDELE